jgi:hypothetical protein
MKKTGVWLMAILLILQCCISGCAQSDNGKDDTIGEVSTITTTAQTTVNTTTSNTINISTTSITESMTADTSTTSKSTKREPTVVTTVRRYDQILSKKTIKNTYILSTKYPNDLNNHCVVRTLSEQENALLTNLFNAPNVTFREERDGWVKYKPSRPNEYAIAIDFTDDTCMILAIHFDIIMIVLTGLPQQ